MPLRLRLWLSSSSIRISRSTVLRQAISNSSSSSKANKVRQYDLLVSSSSRNKANNSSPTLSSSNSSKYNAPCQ